MSNVFMFGFALLYRSGSPSGMTCFSNFTSPSVRSKHRIKYFGTPYRHWKNVTIADAVSLILLKSVEFELKLQVSDLMENYHGTSTKTYSPNG